MARKKNLILRSYQSANLIELLHYHHCDSRSPTKAEHLKCLLNLQVRHVHARFAVFLTGKLTVSVLPALEGSGRGHRMPYGICAGPPLPAWYVLLNAWEAGPRGAVGSVWRPSGPLVC